MLETIKSEIDSTPCISFEEYYCKYIISMQDILLDLEIEFAESRNKLDSNSILKLLASYESR